MAHDLTKEARAGYEGAENRYLYSSPAYYAHSVGAWFKETGRLTPTDVRMGRGYSIRVRDMRFAIKDAPKGAPRAVLFDRVE